MFEDSLVESTGRIHTRSKWFAVGSFGLQTMLLATLSLIPYLYPDSLPRQALSTLLVASPPPAAPAQLPRAPAVHAANVLQLAALVAPSVIPHRILEGDSAPSTPPGMDIGTANESAGSVHGALPLLGIPPPTPPAVVRPRPSGPLRISAGVAAGRLLTPIQPTYPAIAKETRIQGTVVIDAVISKQGFVEQAHVVSGPSLLAQAALAAVNRARYQPFKLNGDAVEVATTINIIFTLDN